MQLVEWSAMAHNAIIHRIRTMVPWVNKKILFSYDMNFLVCLGARFHCALELKIRGQIM